MESTEDFYDTTICVGEDFGVQRFFFVHKVILSSRCEVFAAMFRTDMKEKDESFIQVILQRLEKKKRIILMKFPSLKMSRFQIYLLKFLKKFLNFYTLPKQIFIYKMFLNFIELLINMDLKN